MRSLANLFIKLCVCLAPLWTGSVLAQTPVCPAQLQVIRLDGSVVCLNHTQLGATKPRLWNNTISELVSRSVNYEIALPTSEQCGDRVGLGNEAAGRTDFQGQRRKAALGSCDSANCSCKIAISDGREVTPNLWRESTSSVASVAAPTSSPTITAQRASPVNSTSPRVTLSAPPSPADLAQPAPVLATTTPAPAPAVTNQTEERKRAEVARAEALRVEEQKRADAAQAEAARLRAELAHVQQQLTQANSREYAPANRKALVIGNDRYQSLPKLRNAAQDARLLGDNLRKVGYRVSLQLDQTEKQMKAALRQFKNSLDPGDEVVVFYAGHGVQLSGSNYLIPVDTVGDSEDAVRDESIALQRILDDIADRRAQVALIILDACRDNPFSQAGRSAIGGTRGLAPTSAATGQMIVYSAGSGQQALDSLGPKDTETNSVFTRVFVREMHKPGLSLDKIVRNVRTEVVNLARSVNHEQVPAIYDQVIGEYFFIKP